VPASAGIRTLRRAKANGQRAHLKHVAHLNAENTCHDSAHGAKSSKNRNLLSIHGLNCQTPRNPGMAAMKSMFDAACSLSKSWTATVLRVWGPALAAFAIILSSGFYANTLFSTALSQSLRSF
jgi:hypothetical protein